MTTTPLPTAVSPRQRRLNDLMKARANINRQIANLTIGGARPPRIQPPEQPRPTGRIANPFTPDAPWKQQARINQVLLEDLYHQGERHITHRDYAPGHYGKRNGQPGPRKAVA